MGCEDYVCRCHAVERFVMVQDNSLTDSEAKPPQINIVLNGFEELKERVPVP